MANVFGYLGYVFVLNEEVDMKPPARVFLSSTYDDLAHYREQVMRVLASCETVCKGMEFFGASQDTPLATCLRELKSCTLVIVLLGTRYGSCPPGGTKSFTEHEIDHAVECQIPLWVYVLDDEHVPVLRKYVDVGAPGARLEELKQRLRRDHTVELFTTPEDLGVRLAVNLPRHFNVDTRDPTERTGRVLPTGYRECAYDLLAPWYDCWYDGHWRKDQPCETICSIAGTYFESERGSLDGKPILDVACGTGNTFVAFTRRNLEVWGTDGSREMLLRAKANCDDEDVDTSKLVLEPINWTDRAGYRKRFAAESFDLIINTANSFCHIPASPEYMQLSLRNFYELLKPGGLLFIDTKKYIRTGPHNDAPIFKELQYDADAGDWRERCDREEIHRHDEYGDVRFHTRIMYDLDPSFDTPVHRALIVITIFSKKLVPRSLVVPYYPLPAKILEAQLELSGFKAKTYPAYEKLNVKWKYDFVVGRKPTAGAE
ncbi:MAG: DUF4062 domain-containing protein [Planctomycetota bacterium]